MATPVTIAGLTAVLAGDMDDTVLLEIENNDGVSRKATLAQLRVALNAQAQSFLSTISVTGTSTLTGDVIASVIRRGTADGADNSELTLSGGGAAGVARGGYINLYGNESGGQGQLQLIPGNIAGASISFYHGAGTESGRMIGGTLAWGTTVTTSAAAGEIVLANTKKIRGVNAAGTDTVPMIALNANEVVDIGGGQTVASAFCAVVGVAAANLPAGGATKNRIITLDETNNRFVYYLNGNRYYLTGTSF